MNSDKVLSDNIVTIEAAPVSRVGTIRDTLRTSAFASRKIPVSGSLCHCMLTGRRLIICSYPQDRVLAIYIWGKAGRIKHRSEWTARRLALMITSRSALSFLAAVEAKCLEGQIKDKWTL